MAGNRDSSQWQEIIRGLVLVSQVGLLMAGCIVAGLFLGYWLLGFWGATAGIILGVASGFYQCYRVLTSPLDKIPDSKGNYPSSPESRDDHDRQ